MSGLESIGLAGPDDEEPAKLPPSDIADIEGRNWVRTTRNIFVRWRAVHGLVHIVVALSITLQDQSASPLTSAETIEPTISLYC